MNKKIKIIDLLNKIANKEKVPEKIIKIDDINIVGISPDTIVRIPFVWDKDINAYVSEKDEVMLGDFIALDAILNDEVEILEDNTEEIEELDRIYSEKGDKMMISWNYNEQILVDKINELGKAINELRKEKE